MQATDGYGPRESNRGTLLRPQPTPIQAVQVISRMRGASQSRLMLADDGNLWVVKGRNNPQHTRVLANEWIGTRVAAEIGLQVPACRLILVPQFLVEANGDMLFTNPDGTRTVFESGFHFASRYAGGLMPLNVMDHLPGPHLRRVGNLQEFAGALALDKWLGNCDTRQAVFHKNYKQACYKAAFIDQGNCFGAGEWRFPDLPLQGTFSHTSVYDTITGWKNFDPWLNRIENFSPRTLEVIMEEVPPHWFDEDYAGLNKLRDQILRRRRIVKGLLAKLRTTSLCVFENWRRPTPVPTSVAPPTCALGMVETLAAFSTAEVDDHPPVMSCGSAAIA